MNVREYDRLDAPMFDFGMEGYIKSGGQVGLFLRNPLVGPERMTDPFWVMVGRRPEDEDEHLPPDDEDGEGEHEESEDEPEPVGPPKPSGVVEEPRD
jgi:hypothetical protein